MCIDLFLHKTYNIRCLFFFLLQIFHPVNYLRNVAIDNVLTTKFVLYNDADFITNSGAHERIKTHIDKGVLKERQVSKFPTTYFHSFVYLRKVVYLFRIKWLRSR